MVIIITSAPLKGVGGPRGKAGARVGVRLTDKIRLAMDGISLSIFIGFLSPAE